MRREIPVSPPTARAKYEGVSPLMASMSVSLSPAPIPYAMLWQALKT